MKLSEVLSSPEQWCKGELWRGTDGKPALRPEDSCSSCLYGACYVVHPDDDEARETLYAELTRTLELRGDPRGPIMYNDDHSTTFDDVRTLILETEQRLGNTAEEQR